MFLANKMHLAKGLTNMCLDCKDKDKDCLVIKLGKCPFKEGTCSKVTISLWMYYMDENLGHTPGSQLTNAIASLQTSIFS